MTFTIDGLTVEVTAKGRYSRIFNKRDTITVMNWIRLAFCDAAERNAEEGLSYLSRCAETDARSIFDTLDENGAYEA